ncbi:ABC transporter permease subunit [Saxibacter everestensis]|uniref:ABC transporter permease subunit n=1 Tax=Saxibacter everestensis TaxID=2909229 RepID=A0ABY8QTW3_9MICO|nr:ABC transporter permease subunit [Brevibacteriaceae bacterium ZFBP1038]
MSVSVRTSQSWVRRALKGINLPGMLFLVGLAVTWQLVVALGVVTLVFFPAPSEVINSWFQLLLSGQMLQDIGHTLTAAGIGWVSGSLIGLVVGVWLGISAASWKYGMATIDFLRSIPAICFVSVAALLLGFSLQMELVVAIYASLWPVLINTVEGIRRVEGLYLDTARTLQVSRVNTIFKVMLPAAAGSIIVGLRLALGLALTLAVAAEMVGNPAGVGFQLIMQQQALQPANMFAYIITIGILGMILNRLFIVLIRLVRPGIVASLREDA